MIQRDDLPETPDWVCEPRCNPLDCKPCAGEDEEHLVRGEN